MMAEMTGSGPHKGQKSLGHPANKSAIPGSLYQPQDSLCMLVLTWKIAFWGEKEVTFLELDQHFQHMFLGLAPQYLHAMDSCHSCCSHYGGSGCCSLEQTGWGKWAHWVTVDTVAAILLDFFSQSHCKFSRPGERSFEDKKHWIIFTVMSFSWMLALFVILCWVLWGIQMKREYRVSVLKELVIY